MKPLRWIDTHNHLFVLSDEEQTEQVKLAREMGVEGALICAGDAENFRAAGDCAHRWNLSYALGLHPLYIREEWEQDIEALSLLLRNHIDDRHLAAVGECGLDFSPACSVDRDVQIKVFEAHLKLAKEFSLPLSMHGRGAMDVVLKFLRRHTPLSGVIHAFNGSRAQAEVFLKLGFKLGYGGAMTYERSKRIRSLFSDLPKDAWVLETDCPDMPASWRRVEGETPESKLYDIAYYGKEAAVLRSVSVDEISEQSIINTKKAFPRL